MSILDRIMGRFKKTAGEVAGDESVRREGLKEERKGEAKQEAEEAEQEAVRKRREAADLDQRT